jgi:hypothetical protein
MWSFSFGSHGQHPIVGVYPQTQQQHPPRVAPDWLRSAALILDLCWVPSAACASHSQSVSWSPPGLYGIVQHLVVLLVEFIDGAVRYPSVPAFPRLQVPEAVFCTASFPSLRAPLLWRHLLKGHAVGGIMPWRHPHTKQGFSQGLVNLSPRHSWDLLALADPLGIGMAALPCSISPFLWSDVAMSSQRSFKIGSFRFAAFVPKKIEWIETKRFLSVLKIFWPNAFVLFHFQKIF